MGRRRGGRKLGEPADGGPPLLRKLEMLKLEILKEQQP
jgi:hypothetical protein